MDQNNKISLYSLDFTAMASLVEQCGQPAFRAKQMWQFLYEKRIGQLSDMHNLPKAFIEQLTERYCLYDMQIDKCLTSTESNTWKYLLRTDDNQQFECVLLKYKHGYTLCVSSQVGCVMGCSFCASTIGGLARHLSAHEMMEQILLINHDQNIRINHVVMMGSGEPLHNYDQSLAFIKRVSDPNYLGLSQRHITLSTCGLVDRIYDLAAENLQITLAVSLHTPFDDERNQLVPVNRKFSIAELIRAIDTYFETTKRRVTIEYTLIKGKNDSRRHVEKLVKLLAGRPIHINLIGVNPITESDQQSPDRQVIDHFRHGLERAGLHVTVRRSLGDDIGGACGQLRRSQLK